MFEFSIKEILPHVYHLHFGSGYDLAMHFLRFQEYYESTKYYKKIFSLVEFMEWYAKDHEGSFTYPTDWSGFNVPSWVLRKVRQENIPDLNPYDQRMFAIIDWVNAREFPHDFYFIGTSSKGYRGDESEERVLDHEIAHALYTVNPEYRKGVSSLLKEWNGPAPKHAAFDGSHLDSAKTVLKIMGYHESTIEDEIHAYCATGLCDELKGVVSKSEMRPFRSLFREYKKKCTNEM